MLILRSGNVRVHGMQKCLGNLMKTDTRLRPSDTAADCLLIVLKLCCFSSGISESRHNQTSSIHLGWEPWAARDEVWRSRCEGRRYSPGRGKRRAPRGSRAGRTPVPGSGRPPRPPGPRGTAVRARGAPLPDGGR